jgi:hypothetical protein
MTRLFARTGILLVVLSGPPAFAFEDPLGGLQLANFNPLDRGPREQAIPREVVAWHRL